jgi:hypothetical protein
MAEGLIVDVADTYPVSGTRVQVFSLYPLVPRPNVWDDVKIKV